MYTVKFVALLALSCLCLVFGTPDGAQASNQDSILLTIQTSATGDSPAAEHKLCLSDLKALPAISFTTTTNWTEGPQAFTGVPLLTLLESFGITSGDLELIAINEYSITLPVDDPTNKGAVIAYLTDGETMTARDKGPLWMVYDYDSDPIYQSETVYSRSIWQLDRIIISR